MKTQLYNLDDLMNQSNYRGKQSKMEPEAGEHIVYFKRDNQGILSKTCPTIQSAGAPFLQLCLCQLLQCSEFISMLISKFNRLISSFLSYSWKDIITKVRDHKSSTNIDSFKYLTIHFQ